MKHARLLAPALFAALLAPAAAPAPLAAQPAVTEYGGAAGLGLSLRRLGTAKRVLMVGAHPDDEDTQLLAALALEQGADVAYLSLTRGEGGQNGIGTELHEALGLLRTEELLAARRVDGARQFFSRAYDFGFSKSADETDRHWPRADLLCDVVRVVRLFQPDLVVPVFSGTPRDGHGHHQVSAMLAREAFEAAGDPARCPEQAAQGLRPHRPARLFQSLRTRPAGATTRLAVGGLDPLLGRSPFQLAMASRSRHRSQDMGQAEPAGPRWNYLRRILPAPTGEGENASPWAGVDTTLSGIAAAALGERTAPVATRLAEYEARVGRIRAAFNPLRPDAIVDDLGRAVALLDRAAGEAREAPLAGPESDRLARRITAERADAAAALTRAAGLVLDAEAEDARLVPGQSLTVELSLWNGGQRAVRVDRLEPVVPAGWTAEPLDALPAEAAPGTLVRRRFRVQLPAGAAVSEAYFLRTARGGDVYEWPAETTSADGAAGLPFDPAPLRALAVVGVAGVEAPLEAEATRREVDLRQGELRRPVRVVPAVSVLTDPSTTILPLGAGAPRPLRLRVRLAAEAPGGIAGTLRVAVPAGWRAEPAALPVRFAAPGEAREVEVVVHPAAATQPGDFAVTAAFEAEDGRRFTRGVQMVDYPHVAPRPLFHPAAWRVRAFDVRVPAGLRVAYVEGAGEEGPGVLAQLGIRPALLTADSLAAADLSRYDVIVTGSRAYEVRADLAQHNARLLEYVRRGGTLVVQYNKYELVQGGFTPYPITMARPHGRVTDETAPVRILDPAHPVFAGPNRITAQDFAGWTQERGLYFADTWDPAYTPLLETADPGGSPLRGGLLVAKHGEGTYVYTGLAFFRQLPEGVPGAWRLFANLLALGAR